MTDTTFSAIAERALNYQIVQRKSQMSKTAFLARTGHSQKRHGARSPEVCVVV